MEGEGEPSIQAVQSHICTRWTRLLGSWTSGISAALYGCAPGLPGQDARQWGSRSGCSFTQRPEERDRPGSTCHQSHRPSHRASDVQPDSIRAPPLAHDDGDERGGQSSFLDAPVLSGSLFGPSVEGMLNTSRRLRSHLRRCKTSSLSAPSSSAASSRPRPAPN